MAVKTKFYYTLTGIVVAVAALAAGFLYHTTTYAASLVTPIPACVIAQDVPLTHLLREKIAQCIGWQASTSSSLCHGGYQLVTVTPLAPNEVHLMADSVSFYAQGRSQLAGNVEVRETQRIVNAQTAYVYRDAKTNTVTRIELFDEVRYIEPDKFMIARKATINPQDKSGQVEDVIYRFNTQRAGATLPAWGRATLVERFANQNYLLKKATYSTCAPQDKAWQIEASEITLNHAESKGVAKNAILRIGDWPLIYTPYLSFPTSKVRKSGFLMPMFGYSNIGGGDVALPYYWNIAPNYDATIVPHLYTLRGLMMGGDFRFLTNESGGLASAHFLPQDHAFNQFLDDNKNQYSSLEGVSNNRWSVLLHENTNFSENLQMNINYQQVSDDYYLQDFSTNLAIVTESQLLRQGDVTYTTDHWFYRGMVQSYQTLHPINQSDISDIYERLPQLQARAAYTDLPLNANFNLLGEYDNFHWPANNLMQPQGPRYHVSPDLSFPFYKPWGYVTPGIGLVENNYDVHYKGSLATQSFNRAIPRYYLDSGLSFERFSSWMGTEFTQTLEPRLYYLNVPYHDQTPIPVYDSAYMIFNYDQLFRDNRFSGFDRISDANQMAYAMTSRWLDANSGREKASFALGQIRYFADRRVQLCYQQNGSCYDSSLMLGYVSPKSKSSPIASRAVYHVSSSWLTSGDYVWDPYTHATNNANLNFHYQPAENHIISLGYSYLVSGNLLQVASTGVVNDALHQATVAYAWPFTERWSGLGAYSYNVSKGYDMMTFLGVQYDSCCWAVRLMGGRTFQSISPTTLGPQYNSNVYLQILLKGLGSVANSDPASTINSYLPGYHDVF